MQTTNSNLAPARAEAIIATAALATVFLLVIIDKDTHTAADVFSLRLVPAVALYGLPAFVVTVWLHRRLSRKDNGWTGLRNALLIGLPLTVASVMILLFALKGLGVLGAW